MEHALAIPTWERRVPRHQLTFRMGLNPVQAIRRGVRRGFMKTEGERRMKGRNGGGGRAKSTTLLLTGRRRGEGMGRRATWCLSSTKSSLVGSMVRTLHDRHPLLLQWDIAEIMDEMGW